MDLVQVPDWIAFIRSPEERADAVVVYVNDMGKAKDWGFRGNDTSIDTSHAWFVVGSRETGGMGTPEVIPFGAVQSATAFAAENGGGVVWIDGIPDAYVLGPVALVQEISSQVPGAIR